MMKTPFDPQACHKAIRNGVTAIYGWSDDGELDERNVFYVRLVHETGLLLPGKHLVDLGPGLSAFGPVMRQLGMKVTLVDDFGGGGGVDIARRNAALQKLAAFQEKLGINVAALDFLSNPLPLESGSADIVTCLHSLEHWHHSPKPLFREITRVLKPAGFLIIATPNAVNLRKRLAVPLGITNYGTLEEWYHDGDPVYRGHVREPIVRDLQRLLEWNNFEVVSTLGRNFIGRDSIALGFLPKSLMHSIAIATDYVIRFFPSLCSDIHVIGKKWS